MAELSAAETTAADACCAPEAQASCCEPSVKADCCGHEEGCGCTAGSEPRQATDTHERLHLAATITPELLARPLASTKTTVPKDGRGLVT
jgi:hypothetical protein